MTHWPMTDPLEQTPHPQLEVERFSYYEWYETNCSGESV